jgi:hypothetical protein
VLGIRNLSAWRPGNPDENPAALAAALRAAFLSNGEGVAAEKPAVLVLRQGTPGPAL